MTAEEVFGAGTSDAIPPGPAGPPWTYSLEHEAWYASIPGCVAGPEIVVHHEAYKPTGGRDGCEWQFVIRWVHGRIVLDVEEADEAAVRIERPELLDTLEDLPATAPWQEVVWILHRLGFVDATARVRREPSYVPELPR